MGGGLLFTFLPSRVCTLNTSRMRASSPEMEALMMTTSAWLSALVMVNRRLVWSLPSTVSTVHSLSLLLSNSIRRDASVDACCSTADISTARKACVALHNDD